MDKRTFGKNPRPPLWKRIVLMIYRFFHELGDHANFGGHHDRMQRRKKKNRFDKW